MGGPLDEGIIVVKAVVAVLVLTNLGLKMVSRRGCESLLRVEVLMLSSPASRSRLPPRFFSCGP